MKKPTKIFLGSVFGCVWTLLGSGGVAAQPKNTFAEEKICKSIGFRPKTEAFGSCVLELVDRAGPSSQPNPKSASALAPDEQTCSKYGFKPRTQPFAQCLMQVDQAKRDAQIAQQQYEMQVAQYQQQLAAYQAQQDAIKKERDRRKWEMLGRLGAGMANSTSPSFLGALNEGLAAANGVPIAQPVAPSFPRPRTHTMVLPNGSVVTCTTTGSVTNCF
jgi:hypothetical protein